MHISVIVLHHSEYWVLCSAYYIVANITLEASSKHGGNKRHDRPGVTGAAMAIIGCGAQPTSNQLGGLGAMQYMQYACPRGWDQIRSTQLNASEPQQTALGRQRTLVDAGFPCQKNKSCCLMSPKICLSWLRSVCWIENPMSSLFHWRSFSWGDCKAS